MADRTERAVVNHLIETCRDAEEGFRVAAANAITIELKTLLLRLAEQRHEFAEQLLPHAYRLGDASTSVGTSAGTLHRGWIRLRARLSSDPDRAVVSEAGRGEHFALAAYDDAIRAVVPPDARELIAAQQVGIEVADHLLEEAVQH